MRMVVIAWRNGYALHSSKANIQICILNIPVKEKKISFAW